jgi:hypothetical protein
VGLVRPGDAPARQPGRADRLGGYPSMTAVEMATYATELLNACSVSDWEAEFLYHMTVRREPPTALQIDEAREIAARYGAAPPTAITCREEDLWR